MARDSEAVRGDQAAVERGAGADGRERGEGHGAFAGRGVGEGQVCRVPVRTLAEWEKPVAAVCDRR